MPSQMRISPPKRRQGRNRNGKNTETVRFNITANASLANYVVNDNDPRMYEVRAAPGGCAVSVPPYLAGVDLFE